MENFDIYNVHKEKTGAIGERDRPLPPGQYRFVVRVIVFNTAGDQVLVQKRSANKRLWPGRWEITAAGGALAGEPLYKSAERELFEELGISLDLSTVPSRMTVSFHEGWDEIWVVQHDVALSELTLATDEVEEVRWVTEPELRGMLISGDLIPDHFAHNIFDYIRYDGEASEAGEVQK